MTRFTRSQRRNNAILEDELTAGNENQIAPESNEPASPGQNRPPLGVIDVNEEAATVMAIDEMVVAGEKSKAKAKGGKKAKGGRKGKKQPPIELVVETGKVEVVEDEEVVQTSPASEEACRELLGGSKGSQKLPKLDDSRPRTPPSRAVREARRKLSRPGTPRFESTTTIQDPPEVDATNEANGKETEDSFVEKIISRTPGRHSAQLDESRKVHDVINDGKTCAVDDEGNDSFVEKIIMRSPAKPITRIEDSVEAIDALEDAIEQIGEAIVEKSLTPKKGKKPTKVEDKVNKGAKPQVGVIEPRTTRSSPRKQDRPPAGPKAVKPPTTTKRAAERKPKPFTAKPTVGKTVQDKPAKKQSTTTATTVTTNDESTSTASSTASAARRVISTKATSVEAPTLKRRPVSVSFPPPPPPAKSTKPPTRPTFELPGEAISRKLKEQREERLKRALEEEQDKREFKAKPVRKSMAPVTVRGTASSRARESLMRIDGGGTPPGADKTSESTADATRGRRSSSGGGIVGEAKRMSTARLGEQLPPMTKRPHLANTSSTRVSSTSSSVTSRKLSMSVHAGPASSKSTVTPADAVQQRFRGKEVFERDNKEKAERERIRREKEAAAKKAREEAAERGRQASREWAEKQRLKVKATMTVAGGGAGAGAAAAAAAAATATATATAPPAVSAATIKA